MTDLLSRREALFALVFPWILSATGCSHTPAPLASRPGKRKATPFLDPSDLLPADAALVLRVDRQRLRAAARLAPVELALQRALKPMTSLRKLLQGAEVMWIALREIPVSSEIDGVLAMTADLRAFDPTRLASETSEGWHDVGSGEPGVLVYQRQGAVERSAPSLIVVLRNQLMLLATPLEADGVLKILRGGAVAVRKEIPADAALAFQLSAPSQRGPLGQRYPGLVHLMRESTMVGSLDVDAGVVDEVRLDITISSPSAERSTRLETLCKALASEAKDSKIAAVSALGQATTFPRPSSTELRVLCRAKGVDVASLVDAFPE